MVNTELLLEYQNIDAEFMEFEAKLKDTETRRQMNQRKRVYKSAHDKLTELEQTSKLKSSRIAELEKQYKALTEDMEDLDKDISYYSECSDDELDAGEIKQMAQNAERIYDSIVKVKKTLMQLKGEFGEDAKNMKSLLMKLKTSRAEFEELKQQYEKEMSVGEPKRREFEKRLKEMEDKLPADIIEQYKRIKTLKQNPVAIFKDSRCSGCNMQLPSSIGAKIAASEKPFTCENCGRLLVLPPNG